jgi:phage-related protein
MAGQTVIVSILADGKKATQGLDDVASSFDKLGKITKGFAVGAGIAIGAVALGVGKLVADSVAAAGESQKVAAQTDAVVKSTGKAAERSSEQIGDLALKLSNITGIDDEVVQGAENILLTFTKIKGDNFDRTTEAVLDMSTALGTDANSAAQTLGKALNDPVGGLTKLTKAGVQFTDQQKEQVKALVQIGDVAGAQGIILDELETQFGGSAEAYGATFEGLKDRVSNAFGNIQETFGTAFLPVLSEGLEDIALLLQEVGESDRFQEITANVADFVGGLVDGAPGVADFIGNAADFVSTFSPLVALFQLLDPYIPRILSGAEKLGKVVGGELSDAWTELYPVLRDTAIELKDNLAQALEDNGPALDQLGQNLLDLATNLAEDLIPAVSDLVTQIAPLLPQIVELGTDSLPVLLDILNLLLTPTGENSNTFQLLAGAIGAVLSAVGFLIGLLPGPLPLFAQLKGVLDGTISTSQFLSRVFSGDLGPVIQNLGRFVFNMADLIRTAMSNARQNITSMVDGVKARVDSVFSALPAPVRNAFSNIANAARDGIGNVVSTVGSIPGRVAGAVGDLGSLLSRAGGDIVSGLVNGVRNNFGRISGIAQQIGQTLLANVKSSLGIASPSREMKKLGAFAIQGFAGGLSNLSPVRRAMSSLTDLVTTTPTLMATAEFSGSGAGRGGVVNYVTVEMLSPTPQNARLLAEMLDDHARMGGAR